MWETLINEFRHDSERSIRKFKAVELLTDKARANHSAVMAESLYGTSAPTTSSKVKTLRNLAEKKGKMS